MGSEDAGGLLRLLEVTMRFGGITALDSLTLDIPAGAIVGLIGPNGAGKTTVFNVITGAYRADHGKVVFGSKEISRLPPYRIARAGVARTFQNVRLFASMTVWEHLLLAQSVGDGWARRLFPSRTPSPELREQAEEVLEHFRLEAVRDNKAVALPYGVQRRVEIARAIAARPRILLLDEPAAGMNADEGHELQELLLSVRDRGLTILLIEHDMPFVMNLCEYLYVLDFGALISRGMPGEVQSDPAVLEAYLGKEEA